MELLYPEDYLKQLADEKRTRIELRPSVAAVPRVNNQARRPSQNAFRPGKKKPFKKEGNRNDRPRGPASVGSTSGQYA